jgi:PAS domain S-box-containing protein
MNKMRPGGSNKSILFVFCSAVVFCLFTTRAVQAEQLPLKLYTSAEGLASGAIFHILRDSRGFLWFSTRDGLSRFDGREFVNYRLDDSNAPVFNATHETRDGTFWISASGGIYRVKPDSSAEVRAEAGNARNGFYRTFKAENVSKKIAASPFYEDSRGRLWSGGTDPLLISENGELRLEEFELGTAAKSERGASVAAINETPDGSVWFGCDGGALRLLPDGRRILYPIKRLTTYDETRSILTDEAGRIWVGHRSGVFVFQPETLDVLADASDLSVRELAVEEKIVETPGSISLPDAPGKMLRLMFAAENSAVSAKPQTWNIERIFKTFDGQIWVPAHWSLFVFERGSVRRVSDTNGFPGTISYFAEDAERNVWIGTQGGALEFNRAGLTSWGLADGMTEPGVHSFYSAPNGELFIVHGNLLVSRFVKGKIETARLRVPDADRILWTSPAALLDSSNNWWAITSGGLYRFAGAENLSLLNQQDPAQIVQQKDGFRTDSFYAAFEDSGGNLWVSTRGTAERNDLARLDAKTKQWRFFTEAHGFPKGAAPRAFVEDFQGNLWLGFYDGGFSRYSGGSFKNFSNAEGAPRGGILALHVDGRGRLWIGSNRDGLSLVENPDADNLIFKRFTTAEGLASNNVRSLTSDLAGNIYVGTIRGVDRLDPETGNVRHYSTADGLASDNVSAAFRDKDGSLWFGTFNGLSKLEPGSDLSFKNSDLRILINSLQIAGNDYSVSEFGRETIENLKLTSSENNLQIQFLSVGSGLRYQYKLEGDRANDWSQPTAETTVNFAGLAPGDYRFLVRAVDSDNRTSENPAKISFSIAPPFWRTWEFIGAMIFIAGFGVFLLDRYRVAKTRQVESALIKSQMAEKATKESETRFRTLAETASDAIITIDETSRIIFVNPAVEKIFGYQTEELIGANLTILMPEKMRGLHDAGFGRYLQSSRKNMDWSGIELPGQHKSGAELPIEVSFGEFERDGRRYFTGIIRDISERRKAEEALQNAREERIRELQRVRTRIATDLHDDIGSSLTQISVLTEVARSQAILETVKTPLERISNVSNELVDSMADIVWAINPKKDSLRELILRMRRFASDVLSAREIEFELESPEDLDGIQFGANIRREVFAIFKECINNIVRHAEASEVLIRFEINENHLRLQIKDNGRGFDAEHILSDDFSPEKGGNGLTNMRRRAMELGGICEIISGADGTTTMLDIPLSSVDAPIHTDSNAARGNELH